MPRSIALPDDIHDRLVTLGNSLFEPAEVIRKLLDKYHPVDDVLNPIVARDSPAFLIEAKAYNPASPPPLTHTKILSAALCGRVLENGDATWNGLLNTAILEATAKLKDPALVKRLIVVNCLVGRKEDEGYRFLPKAGISVQGQDAAAAWKATHHIARQLGCSFDIVFTWRHKEDAAYPGATGRFIST